MGEKLLRDYKIMTVLMYILIIISLFLAFKGFKLDIRNKELMNECNTLKMKIERSIK